MRSSYQPSATGALALVAWLGASGFIYWAMSHGPGISPDSVVYLAAAKSLLAGGGFVSSGVPVTHFPPGYPLMIAAVGLLTQDVVAAAKIVAAFWFGANVVLVGYAAYLATRCNLLAAGIASLLFATAVPVLYAHGMAWSEAPFFAFALSGLLVLAGWLAWRIRQFLVLACVCLSLAMMTRYVGIVLLAPLAVAVMFVGERAWRDRVRDGVIAFGIAALPLALWFIRNTRVSHTAADRTLAVHPVTGDQLVQAISTLSDYFLPVDMSAWFKGIVLVLLVAVLWRGIRAARRIDGEKNWSDGIARHFGVLSAVFMVTYITFLVVVASFADAMTPLDERLLFPVFGLSVVTLVMGCNAMARVSGRPVVLWALAGFTLLCIGVRFPPAIDSVTTTHTLGDQFASDHWRESEMLGLVRALPEETEVYSNAQEAIAYLTDRITRAVPDSILRASGRANSRYHAQQQLMCRRVLIGRAVVAFFTTDGQNGTDSSSTLGDLCPFTHSESHADGVIFSGRPEDITLSH